MSSNNVQSEKGTQSRDGETTPLVSIGLPTYNREVTLPRALDSLLNQTYQNIELIISDNASTDRTYDICQAYLKKDARIRYYRNDTNIGMTGNFNRVFHLSKGKYIMFANDDDEWDSDYIEKNVKALERNPQAILSYTGVEYVDFHKNRIVTRPYPHSGNSDAYIRAREVITFLGSGIGQGIPTCGIIRPECMRQTTFPQNCYGPDILLLLELALIGPFNLCVGPLLKKTKPNDRNADIMKSSYYNIGYRDNVFNRFIYRTKILPLMLRVVITSNLKKIEKLKLVPPICVTFCKFFLLKTIKIEFYRIRGAIISVIKQPLTRIHSDTKSKSK